MKAQVKTITPEIAANILKEQNDMNRAISPAQIKALTNNILENGWIEDGQPVVFNEHGHLLEGQHRLVVIKELGITANIVVVEGVADSSFSVLHGAKPRTPIDVINRGRDTPVSRDDVACIGSYVKRELGDKLSNSNALFYYERFRGSLPLVNEMSDPMISCDAWSTQRKEIRAFCLRAIKEGRIQEAALIVESIEQAWADETAGPLFRGFVEYWNEHCPHLANETKLKRLYDMLCYTLDVYCAKGDRIAFKYGV